MTNASGVRVRPSIESLQVEYRKGNKKPLEDVMRAWKGIKELPPDDPNSFFMIGGFHGEPFRGAGWGSASYWGGYCNHGNVLFPTWHRAYLVRLEQALQSIPGCEQVMLPFWDETSEESLTKGIPWALTDPDFELDGVKIPNPLASFTFNRAITDHINGDDPNYSKPLTYVTVRYPLSGLVGTPEDRAATKAHNDKFPDATQNVMLLNRNIVDWLTSYIVVKGEVVPTNVKRMFEQCLDAPNYTLFSNTSSAAQWNDNVPEGAIPVVSLEEPHNKIHLAVGGFDVPYGPNKYDRSPIPGANGDMGENDTAGLDPIFYFHHCFIDRVFWLWQKRHGFTQHLDLIAEYPGTNSVDAQGPTPGTVPNSWLTLESPLDPFKKSENGKERAYTSLDCINIEEQLGYTYGPGSLESLPKLSLAATTVPAGNSSKVVRVTGLNRAPIAGSFLVSAYVNVDGERQLLGTHAVLSRWSVQSCANCQTHVEVRAFFPLNQFTESAVEDAQYEVEVHTREGVRLQTQPASPPASQAVAGAAPQAAPKLFRLEVR